MSHYIDGHTIEERPWPRPRRTGPARRGSSITDRRVKERLGIVTDRPCFGGRMFDLRSRRSREDSALYRLAPR